MTIKTLTSTVGTSLQAYLPQYNLTFIDKEIAADATNFIEPVKLQKIIKNPKELLELSSDLGDLKNELDENKFLKPTFIYPVATSTIVVIIIISILIGIIIKQKCKSSSLFVFLQK